MADPKPTLTWENGRAVTPEGWQYVIQREHDLGDGVWHEAWLVLNGRTITLPDSGAYGPGSASKARAAALRHYRDRMAARSQR